MEMNRPEEGIKVYWVHDGCCICKGKTSSRFIESRKYEKYFMACFKLSVLRRGKICIKCVRITKRFKRLPQGSERHWGHVVDERVHAGKNDENDKTTPEQSEDSGSDIDSTSSDGDTSHMDQPKSQTLRKQLAPKKRTSSIADTISFLSPDIWKKKKVCCGDIFEGPLNAVALDMRYFNPCNLHNIPSNEASLDYLIHKSDGQDPNSAEQAPDHSPQIPTSHRINQGNAPPSMVLIDNSGIQEPSHSRDITVSRHINIQGIAASPAKLFIDNSPDQGPCQSTVKVISRRNNIHGIASPAKLSIEKSTDHERNRSIEIPVSRRNDNQAIPAAPTKLLLDDSEDQGPCHSTYTVEPRRNNNNQGIAASPAKLSIDNSADQGPCHSTQMVVSSRNNVTSAKLIRYSSADCQGPSHSMKLPASRNNNKKVNAVSSSKLPKYNVADYQGPSRSIKLLSSHRNNAHGNVPFVKLPKNNSTVYPGSSHSKEFLSSHCKNKTNTFPSATAKDNSGVYPGPSHSMAMLGHGKGNLGPSGKVPKDNSMPYPGPSHSVQSLPSRSGNRVDLIAISDSSDDDTIDESVDIPWSEGWNEKPINVIKKRDVEGQKNILPKTASHPVGRDVRSFRPYTLHSKRGKDAPPVKVFRINSVDTRQLIASRINDSQNDNNEPSNVEYADTSRRPKKIPIRATNWKGARVIRKRDPE